MRFVHLYIIRDHTSLLSLKTNIELKIFQFFLMLNKNYVLNTFNFIYTENVSEEMDLRGY